MKQPPPLKRSFDKRKVIFGNPSLGTYGGHVHTYSRGDGINNNNFKTDEVLKKMVAITDVPPDQIPEGLLNLARGHRSSIEHIRVLISADSDDDTKNNETKQDDSDANNDNTNHEQKTKSHSPTKHHEDAASILAKEYSQREGNLPFSYHNHRSGRSGKMTQKKKRYIVLISFCSSSAADSFIKNLDGKPYNSFERDVIASVYHIAKLESDCDTETMNTNANAKMSPCLDIAEFKRGRSLSTPSEKQNCAVCLEPMDFSSIKKEKETNSPTGSSMGLTVKKDVSSSSIFTTVCNHSFHTDCLLRCQDSPCPVCRYDHSGLDETLSQCHICGTTERIHICLICGVASCWKGEQQPNNQISSNTKNNAMGKGVESWDTHGCDSRGHARRHYDETLHAYALDTETQHVWDFAGQGYVHRLIQNVDDGKIVEISDPHSGAMERSLIPELSDTQEGEVVHRKLEGYASEYYTLLKSQLEQQRVYYEDIMEQIRREHKTESKGNGSSELIAALKQDRNQIQQRCQVLQRKRNKVVDDVAFLKNMNESLEANKEPLKRQIRLLQNQRKETANMLQRRQPELEEKVQRLMLELENGG